MSMLRYYMSVILYILFSSFVFSASVNIDNAKFLAKDIFSEKEIKNVVTLKNSDINLIYAINFYDNSFILISADDRVFPVLGYSDSNNFSLDNLPKQFSDMLDFYKLQIKYVIENNIQANDEVILKWNNFNINNTSNRNVEPLLNSVWDQGHSWNDQCPEDNAGPGGNAYAGCVAVAAAMVMKYWEHPQFGTGSHSYNHPDYGEVSANFNTTYNWNEMNDNQPTDESRKLLYHVGVSCEMQYGPDGSGAWVGVYEPSVLTGLKSYFGYNQNSVFRNKDDYPEQTWIDIVKIELDQGRPLIYKGYTNDYGAGHAFVIDGYNDDFFHLNWGWSGSYNGNFLITNLSPGGYNFSTWQGAIFQLFPEINIVNGCTDMLACNYNSNATNNDGSCEYNLDCLNECGGVAEFDECGICNGDGSTCAGTANISFGSINSIEQSFEILIDSNSEISGYQFTISDTPNNIILEYFDGGLSEEYNFSVSCSELGIVIGFSFEGEIIPNSTGLLTKAHYSIIDEIDSDLNICFEDVVISNQYGTGININVGSCEIIDICTHSGNLNEDTIINVQDIVIMANMAVSQTNLDLCNGDINNDGIINVQDIVLLVNIVLE